VCEENKYQVVNELAHVLKTELSEKNVQTLELCLKIL